MFGGYIRGQIQKILQFQFYIDTFYTLQTFSEKSADKRHEILRKSTTVCLRFFVDSSKSENSIHRFF